ncbi:unnamed protein product [Candidula unifasciata]|uniref:Homeobox domain-containing protein n=1 Tax=Candidula unifasciata TaxID=100452 RepID=A0A8S3YR54_9EUPU|nr:unnamed protein product [Candidula unifasciata]
MTLTQVSTWFANARRRLKKDNRLSPGGGEDDHVGIDSDREGDMDSINVEDMDAKVTSAHRTEVPLSSEGEGEPDSFSDISDDDNEVFRPESRDTPRVPCKNRVPVITSTSEATDTNLSVASSDTTPTDILATRSDTASSNIFFSSPVASLNRFATTPEKSPVATFATSSAKVNNMPNCQISETQKPKPKIWSISHILDS